MSHPYSSLTPETVLDACAAAGLRPDGRLLGLNSYENRVYQVWLEEGSAEAASIVAKFYRPGRWTREQIDEEHAFARELAGREIPVVAPTHCAEFAGFVFAIYPRRGGRTPNLEDPKVLEWIGRFIGRIHAVGASKNFSHREALSAKTFGHTPRQWLLEHASIPGDLLPSWKAVTEQALAGVEACYERAGNVRSIRLHGDCHPGNILWTDDGPHFVDLDDARMGPAVQDLWMLASDDAAMRALLDGYTQLRDFEHVELALVPALRAMRQLHYAGWIAQRWHDPAFPAAFPFAAEARWWDEHIADLHELADALA